MPSPAKAANDLAQWTLVLFRDELRLADNRAFTRAVALGQPIIAVYVDETPDLRLRTMGDAARWWLHQSLSSLQKKLAARGIELLFFRGATDQVVPSLAAKLRAKSVVWSRRYGAADRGVDAQLKTTLSQQNIQAESFNDRLLYEPWEVKPQSSDYFKVFTPFWKAATRIEPSEALPPPATGHLAKPRLPAKLGNVTLSALGFLPRKPDWAGGLRAAWVPGEAGAEAALERFITSHLDGYADARDRPDLMATSGLSPQLRFGEIGVRQIWQSMQRVTAMQDAPSRDADKFRAELGWREFSYHLLFHQTDLATRCVQPRFENFAWTKTSPHMAAWQQGQTGYPVIDAGMRQLWHSGWMHNRVRMIVASFLVKHLLVDWRAGEAWFWDTLVDADPASNPASWQWVAGCGADAAPYFRIFNPVLQSQKFDPDGLYIKRWIPELANIDASDIHTPWVMLGAASQTLRYASPIIDLSVGRARALAALAAIAG